MLIYHLQKYIPFSPNKSTWLLALCLITTHRTTHVHTKTTSSANNRTVTTATITLRMTMTMFKDIFVVSVTGALVVGPVNKSILASNPHL